MQETRPPHVLSGVFLGEESLVISCATAWLQRGHEIRAVVSDVDEIARWATDNGLQAIAVAEVLETLRAGEPFDYFFSVVNFKLLPDELLQNTCKACLVYGIGSRRRKRS